MGPLHNLSLEQCILLACSWEACVPKVGNVHRQADFHDTTLYDFLTSAALIAPALAKSGSAGVGHSIERAVQLARDATGVNTHLGTILLLAPLCAVPRDQKLSVEIPAVLQAMTAVDARAVYAAIRYATPGGLGTSTQMDVHDEPPTNLLFAMAAAAEQDRIARQFVGNFSDVLDVVAPSLIAAITARGLVPGVVRVQLELMSRWPDSLIARKCGSDVALQSSARAQRIVAQQDADDAAWESALADFDFWLRSDGNRRNPGTTADLIAAGLFVALRDNQLPAFSLQGPAHGPA